jgi:hypothetical protein
VTAPPDPPPPDPPPGYPPPGYPPYAGYLPPRPTSSRASTVLVLGIVALVTFFTFCGLGVVPAIIALVQAPAARREIAASGGALDGSGQVRAGVIMSWVTLGLAVLAIVLVVVVIAVAVSVSDGPTVHPAVAGGYRFDLRPGAG